MCVCVKIRMDRTPSVVKTRAMPLPAFTRPQTHTSIITTNPQTRQNPSNFVHNPTPTTNPPPHKTQTHATTQQLRTSRLNASDCRSPILPPTNPPTTTTTSNFDFRAPEHYLFLPDWMFRALRLRPRDVVSLKFVRLPGRCFIYKKK